ncbi:MAG TPA: leucyl/phenylalanyl-tRNA--protein transferase [Syntrophales bacterium]|nr:leucyl/phenylalanyl-tRNA--protein transferase [Syntrophales bacterium]
MPIFRLGDEITFPPVHLTSGNGILAIGGDLSPDRLLTAYRQGIFPWYSEGDPIIWWSPDPRFVLFLEELRVSRSMMKVLRRRTFSITYDHKFREVIMSCQKARRKHDGTWITDDMLEAYCTLHNLGMAHSTEAWHEGKLVGGIYGVSLGRCFFGESMFSLMSNASKAALIDLVYRLKELKFRFLDCQVYTAHLERLGARYISRKEFIELLNAGLQCETLPGNWQFMPESAADNELRKKRRG